MTSRSKVNGGGSIPLASKKMVQSLKEIVNCPEPEIYATLKDCNMDPNETVNRLLSQDPFREVKSKREKKKESKDVHDSRSRASISSTSCGGRGGADRYTSLTSIAHFGPPDSSSSRGKPTHKKDSATTVHTHSTASLVENNISKVQSSFSDATTERAFPTNTAENFPAALPSSSFQSPWGGTAGQVSMADIVKMGRSHGKASSTFNLSQQLVNNQHAMESALSPQCNDLHLSHNHAFNVSEMNKPSQVNEGYHVSPDDDWTLHEEPPAGSAPSFVGPSVGSELGDDVHDGTKEQFRSRADELRFVGDTGDNTHAIQAVPGSNQGVQEENYGSASGIDNNLYKNGNSIKVHHGEDEEAGMSVSSVTANLQSISLPKEEDSASEEDGPAVKIPDHLQVQSSECSHLSFGTFGSAANAPFSGSFTSRPVENNDIEAPMASGALSAGNVESRNVEYYDDEHLNTASDENTMQRMGNDSGNFGTSSVSQPDVLKEEAPEVMHENQYSFPSSTANYSFENQQQLNASFEQQMSSQMQGLPSFSGVTPYSNSLPGTLLASNMLQPPREAEIAYSPFPISQSIPAKYNNSVVSSINGPTASIAEAMKMGNFSAAQQTQNLPGGSISGGPALPQQLLHPYSQPSVPMGHYASMLGYPFIPQSYPYLPSAFQQAFAAGNSNFPQSLAAAMLPQYKNSVSVNSLPQAAAVASGYGAAFGNSNSMPSNFPMNHNPTASAGTSMSYDDVLGSQYKDASHLLSLQQAQGSRTMSGVPGSAYYSFQGQTQQASQQPQQGGFRQTQQQPSHQQHYTPSLSGYPNFYHHSQAGPTLEQQLQMSRDGSQGQQKQTQQQLWQNGY